MSDSEQILAYLASNKERLKKEYHLTKIGIFGSIVRNDHDANSDIDLIVEFQENTPDLYSIKRNLKAEIQNRFSRPVDICREKYINPYYKQNVISQARYV